MVAVAFACVGLASIGYRLLVLGEVEQTSAMFIGLPTFLGITIALLPSGHPSPMRIALLVTTLALLMSAVILGEGAICILMMAPLAYGIVALTVFAITSVAKKSGWRSMIVAPLALMSLEGVSDELSFDRAQHVVVEAHTPLSVEQVRVHLALRPTFEGELPSFLKLSFPVPTHTSGSGLNIGDARTVHFAGGEGEPGDLTMMVSESEQGHVQFALVEDDSHIAHWLRWRTMDVYFEPAPEGGCDVRWEVRFTRLLDPAWYFGFWERRGVEDATEYLHQELLGR